VRGDIGNIVPLKFIIRLEVSEMVLKMKFNFFNIWWTAGRFFYIIFAVLMKERKGSGLV